jgi:type IV pilus assembly protein PilF
MIKPVFILLTLLSFYGCSGSSKQNQETNSQKADLHYAHGTSLLVSRDFTEALDHLIRSNELKPNDSKTLNNLGMAYYLKGETKLGERHIREAIKIDPKNSDARNNLASLLFTKGELEEAKKEYEIILQDLVYRQQFRVRYNLGLIYLRLNQKARAIDYLKQASLEREDYCAANHQLGLIYKEARQFDEAIDWFTKATRGTCHSEPAPHFQLAETLEQARKNDLARELYNDILQRFPNSSFAPLSRQRLGLLEKAEEMAVKVRRPTPGQPREAVQLFSSPTF